MPLQVNPWRAPVKQPNEIKDYQFNWDEFLDPGVTISVARVTADSQALGALAINSFSVDPGGRRKVTFVTGSGISGNEYHVTCQVDCSNSMTYEKDMVIPVQEQ